MQPPPPFNGTAAGATLMQQLLLPGTRGGATAALTPLDGLRPTALHPPPDGASPQPSFSSSSGGSFSSPASPSGRQGSGGSRTPSAQQHRPSPLSASARAATAAAVPQQQANVSVKGGTHALARAIANLPALLLVTCLRDSCRQGVMA